MPSSACQTCARSEEHTSELQSLTNLVCRLLLEKTKNTTPTSCGQPSLFLKWSAFISIRSSLSSFKNLLMFSPSPPRFLADSMVFFFNDPATPEIYTLSLHDALPIFSGWLRQCRVTRVDYLSAQPDIVSANL